MGGVIPIYLTSICISILINGKGNVERTLFYLVDSIPTMLGLQMSGFFYPEVNGVQWYISSMLVAGFFVYAMARKNISFFANVLAPVLIAVGYISVYHLDGDLDAIDKVGKYWIPLGTMRGFAGLSVGFLIYYISEKLKQHNVQLNEKAMSLLQFCAFALLLFVGIAHPHTRYDFYGVFCCAAIIFVTHNQKAVWSKMFNKVGNAMIPILGKQYTLAVYCFSTLWYTVLRIAHLLPDSIWLSTAIYLASLLVVGLIASRLTDKFQSKYKLTIKL